MSSNNIMPILLDLDGALLDTSAREEKCKRNGKMDWECWFNPDNLSLDKPNEQVISLIRRLNEAVYIASGRVRELQWDGTMRQLEGIGLKADGVFLKPKAWQYAKEYVYKARVAIWLSSHGILINHIIDDNPRVLDVVSNALVAFGYPKPRLWLVRGGSVSEYEARGSSVGWISLEADHDGFKADCPIENIIRIIIDVNAYYALCIDAGVRFRISGLDLLMARVNGREWFSPILTPS